MSDPTEPTGDLTPLEPAGASLIGRYRVIRSLGRGGMGEVYLAEDTLLHRKVALKRVGRELSQDPVYRHRLIREAQQAGHISDPRIASVYDVHEDKSDVVLIMEYVEGQTLRERMSEPVSLDEFWDLALQCVEALQAAHRHGVLHRDIKPDNLIVEESGQVKILDFGIAKRLFIEESATTLSTDTIENKIVGTPAYMPPEAHLGIPLDERSDVFSLGVLFYELLARRRPFTGATRAEVVSKIIREDAEPLHVVNPEVSRPVSNVVGRMLAKDPKHRYPSAEGVLEALLAARRGAWVEPSLPRERSGLHVRPVLWALLASVVGVAALWAFSGGWQPFQPIRLPTDRNVAVLPVVIEGTGEDTEAFALGATVLLTEQLTRFTGSSALQVATAEEVIRADVDSEARARETLGANLVLRSVWTLSDQNYRLSLSLIDAVSGDELADDVTTAPAASPLSILDAQNRAAAKLLELSFVEGHRASDLYGTTGEGSMRFYLEGRGLFASHRTLEDLDRAQERFELAAKTDPAFVSAQTGLAWTNHARYLLDERNPAWLERALGFAEGALQSDSTRAQPHKCLGFILSRTGDVERADYHLRRASQLDPSDDATYTAWGRVHGRRGDAARELEIYEAAVAATPRSWRSHWRLATFLYHRGDFDEARDEFEAMVKLSPDYYRGYSNLGGIYVQEGRYREAVAALEHSLDLRPTEAALSNLGTAYFNNREFDRAIDTYNRAFQFGFGNYLIWINLGDAYHWSPERRDQAREAYDNAVVLGREILAERPYHVEVLANLAPVCARLGERDTARVYIETALGGARGNPNIEYQAALTYWELGDVGTALDWLEKSVAGGVPTVWIRDSIVFDAWRDLERYQRIVGALTTRCDWSMSGKEKVNGNQGDSRRSEQGKDRNRQG